MDKLVLNPNLYHDSSFATLWEQLVHRIAVQPFNLVATLLFFLAICHLFIANRFIHLKKQKIKDNEQIGLSSTPQQSDPFLSTHLSFKREMLFFISELEVVFGIWCIPMLIVMTYLFGSSTTLYYLNRENYTEALFMVVAVALASTYPFTNFVRRLLSKCAALGNSTPAAWWLTVMTIGPILGSFVKETIAMTLSAIILGTTFFSLKPKPALAYLTIALLFVNISVGGSLTNFANSAVYILAKPWNWTSLHMLTTFGYKAVISILFCNFLTLVLFKKEFIRLRKKDDKKVGTVKIRLHVPSWITYVHLGVLFWLVYHHSEPVIFLGSFVLFLGLYQATAPYQMFMDLRTPILIGFFLASLMVLGGLQMWWLEPIITRASPYIGMNLTVFLSAFTHNTVVTYLATQIPNLTEEMKEALFSGTVIGGGLTLMANGPNLVGYYLLKQHFPEGLKPSLLFTAALIPSFFTYLFFTFF